MSWHSSLDSTLRLVPSVQSVPYFYGHHLQEAVVSEICGVTSDMQIGNLVLEMKSETFY
jgi:hypothetical protein